MMVKCKIKCGIPTVNFRFISPFISTNGSVNKIIINKNSKTAVLLFFYSQPAMSGGQNNGKAEEE